MKRRVAAICGAMILASLGYGFSQRAPFYASLDEMRAVLESSDLAAQLGVMRTIDGVERTGRTFTVTSGDCSIEALVTYVDQKTPGPNPGPMPPMPQRVITVGELICP